MTLIEKEAAHARLQVELDRLRSDIFSGLDEPRSGIDRPARPDGNEQVSFRQSCLNRPHFVRHLPEPDDVGAKSTAL